MSLAQVTSISRVCCCSIRRQFHTNAKPLLFYATPNLMGEPMKKRKKADIGKLIARTQSKIRKVEKEMRRLEKWGRKLKPVEEIIGKVSLRRNKENLKREMEPLSEDSLERRALLIKEWSKFKSEQHHRELKLLDGVIKSQAEALKELRLESEDLYQKAIQINEDDIVYSFKGPVETPSPEVFDSPDGLYTDITKKY